MSDVPEVLGEFGGPAGFDGDTFRPADHDGELILIYPHSVEKDVTTDYGTSDATKCKVIVLDGPDAGKELNDVLLFSGPLQRAVSNTVGTGKGNLGRLQKTKFKNGHSGWTLTQPSDSDHQKASDYASQRRRQQAVNEVPPI